MAIIEKKPSPVFWIVAVALLLWGLAGASIYIAYFVETPQEFASTAENAEHAQAYADYVANIPLWTIAIGAGAALARLLGAVGLLARRAWAPPLYIVSLALFSITLFRGFALADAASVMSGPHIAVEGGFLLLGVFAVWFSYRNKSAGVLK